MSLETPSVFSQVQYWNIECSGKFDSPAHQKGSTCWSMLAVNCIAWWCCSSNMSMCKSSRKSFLSSSIHPSSSCVKREGKNKPTLVKRMKTDINYGFSLWTVVGKSQGIPSCDSAAMSWEGACPCAKCGYWLCYLLPQLPPSPTAGLYLQQPFMNSLLIWGNTSKSWGSLGLCTTWLGCIKILQSPKLEHTSCEAASNARRKIWLGSVGHFYSHSQLSPRERSEISRLRGQWWSWPCVSRCTGKGCSPSTRSRGRSNNGAPGCLFNTFVVLIPALQRDLVQPFITAEEASWQYSSTLRDGIWSTK